MGLLLGDVLATIAIIVFSGLAAWAGGVLSALLFPDRTEQASYDLEHRPWGTFFLGLLVAVVVTFVGAVLFGIPATRAIGAFVWLVAVGVAVFGTGGLFRLFSRS